MCELIVFLLFLLAKCTDESQNICKICYEPFTEKNGRHETYCCGSFEFHAHCYNEALFSDSQFKKCPYCGIPVEEVMKKKQLRQSQRNWKNLLKNYDEYKKSLYTNFVREVKENSPSFTPVIFCEVRGIVLRERRKIEENLREEVENKKMEVEKLQEELKEEKLRPNELKINQFQVFLMFFSLLWVSFYNFGDIMTGVQVLYLFLAITTLLFIFKN